MKKILTLTLILLNSTFVFSQFENITDFQKKLIEEEITGSNVAMVYQNGEIIYHHIEIPYIKIVKTYIIIQSFLYGQCQNQLQ